MEGVEQEDRDSREGELDEESLQCGYDQGFFLLLGKTEGCGEWRKGCYRSGIKLGRLLQ